MTDPESRPPGRRDFLRSAALLTGAVVLPEKLAANPAAEPTAPAAAGAELVGYLSLGPDEAAFVEAMVDVMCPADDLTPRGVDCGLAFFIDRQLAGAYGKGARLNLRGPFRPGKPEDGYQLPLTPEQFFKAGIKAADAACLKQTTHRLAELEPDAIDKMLTAFASGETDGEGFPLADWFNELVYPLFVQACFSDPIYGGNRGKVFWKMIGYPGLPAVNGLNMVNYRGKPFPGASQSKSIEDFS